MKNKVKVAYIEGRPNGHPTHSAYANSVNAVFHHVDFRLRYHDNPKSSALKRYLSWLLCALSFPKRKQYSVFLSEEAYFMLGLMRRLGLISKKQKLVAIMGSHTLYFLHTNQYSKRTKKAFIRLFNCYDAFICEGPIQFQLMKNFLGTKNKVNVYQTFNGSPAIRFDRLRKVQPALRKLNIITIGAIPNKNRIYYKGIDLMLSAFNIIKSKFEKLTFTIIGDYDQELVNKMIEECCPAYKHDVIFTGQTNNLDFYLQEACMYLHTARGEAWGISVTEAMVAGVVPIVSDWTGSKEAVEKVSSHLIVPLNIIEIAERMCWYLALPEIEKRELSDKCRRVAEFYTEKNAIEEFKLKFNKAIGEVNQAE